MGITTGLRIALGVLTVPFGIYFLTDAWKSRGAFSSVPWPGLSVTGFITNMLDALGIGSFAQQAAVFKTFKLVDDRVLPGTMNVGNTVPTVVQALLFMSVVAVEPLTLVSMSLAAPAGAVLGAGLVARMSRPRIRLGLGFGLRRGFLVRQRLPLRLQARLLLLQGLLRGLRLAGLQVRGRRAIRHPLVFPFPQEVHDRRGGQLARVQDAEDVTPGHRADRNDELRCARPLEVLGGDADLCTLPAELFEFLRGKCLQGHDVQALAPFFEMIMHRNLCDEGFSTGSRYGYKEVFSVKNPPIHALCLGRIQLMDS